MSYDVLVVGAGISAAALCAAIKHRYRVCVIDTRAHIAGNCFDYRSGNTFVHAYGPHIFHSPSAAIVEFLSRYTEWTPYQHSVTAEINDGPNLRRVPFPYCKLTESVLGETLSPEEIIATFFSDYSRKMWGRDYYDLPTSVQGRVPKDTRDTPQYFPDQFQAIPKLGYTRMIERMFDGVELALNMEEDQWQSIRAERIVYCGRVDRIRIPNSARRYGDLHKPLPFRSLHIPIVLEDWDADTTMVHFCHAKHKATRKTNYGYFHGDKTSRITSYEIPYEASFDQISPYYPIPDKENIIAAKDLQQIVAADFENRIHFLGRLANYQYLDMFQAVGQGLALAKTAFNCDAMHQITTPRLVAA